MSVCRSLKFFFIICRVVCRSLFSLGCAVVHGRAPLPRLVFGRGLPVPAAAARPAPRMALRPAQPRAAAGFSLSSWGSVLFVLSVFLAARPRPLQGGVGHLGAGRQ